MYIRKQEATHDPSGCFQQFLVLARYNLHLQATTTSVDLLTLLGVCSLSSCAMTSTFHCQHNVLGCFPHSTFRSSQDHSHHSPNCPIPLFVNHIHQQQHHSIPTSIVMHLPDCCQGTSQGNITLMQATIQIFSILPSDNFRTEAFGTYVEQLMQMEHECTITTVWGSTGSVPLSSDPLVAESSPQLLEPTVVMT